MNEFLHRQAFGFSVNVGRIFFGPEKTDRRKSEARGVVLFPPRPYRRWSGRVRRRRLASVSTPATCGA